MKLLLENGADVNAEGGKYRNALQAALSKGHKEIVKLLLDKGAEGENAVQAASESRVDREAAAGGGVYQ